MGSPLTPVRKGKYPEWIGGSDEPLAGFSWRSGSDRHTTGITIWSDVFLYDAPNGDKIAILLMDTQGLFDHKSSPTDNSRIFSLSTLISSMQIFNLFSHIQEDHLQYLQFATEYTRFATSNKNDRHTKPFQNLMFLIRDWSYSEDHAYGLQGGQELLNKVMQIEEDQVLELESLRQYIYATFEKISCFLMPHPGITVATKKNYDGRWSQIDEAFIDNLKDLAEALLSPENLTIKKINDQDLQVNEFYQYINQYINMFNSKELPKPQSLYEATVTNHMQIVFAKSISIYNEFVQNGYNNLTEIHEIDRVHNQAEKLATQRYLEEKKMGTTDHEVSYRNLLVKYMNESFSKWKPTAIDHIQKLQEIKRKIEIDADLMQQAQAKADEAKKELGKTSADLQKANLEVERVKHESDEIRAEAKQIQMEAQTTQLELKTLHEEALKLAEKFELEYKKDLEDFKEKSRLQQDQLLSQLRHLRLLAEKHKKSSDSFCKFEISSGENVLFSFSLG